MTSTVRIAAIAIASGHNSPIPGEPGKQLRSAISKQAVHRPIALTEQGLAGDTVTDARFHGGPDQALLIMGEADYRYWELGLGSTPPLGDLPRGLFGENVSLEGWSSYDACIGDQLSSSDWCVEITAPRSPCSTFARIMRSRAGGWCDRFKAAERPGAYVRVLRPGSLELGQTVVVKPYPGRRIRIADVLHAKWQTLTPDAQLQAIIDLPVSSRDRALFMARLNGTAAN